MKQLIIKPFWLFELGLIQQRFQRFFILLIAAFLFIPQIAEAATIVGPTSACQGDKPLYSITATSTYTYEWSVDSKGSMLIAKTVGGKSEGTIEWMVPGSSTITVIVKNGTSVVETLYHYVDVLPRPQPLLTWDVEVGCQIEGIDPAGTDIEPAPCTKVCENSTVTYSTPNVTGSTYTWIVSGGTATPSGNTCTVVWGASGSGTVEVVETSAGGCEGRKALCLDIIKKPRADFQVMSDPSIVFPVPLNVCLFDKIIFKDMSIDNGGTELVSWFWDFGDGTTSSEKDPTHIFTTAGSYRVKLTVKNACNCTSEYELNIIVDEHTGVKIICPSVVCENSIVKYSVVDPCTPYDWDVIGGTIITPSTPPYPSEIEIEWDAVGPDGYGYVIFDGTTCTVDCPSKTAIKVPVIKAVGTIIGKTTICTDKQYRYTLPQWPATDYNWSVTAGGTGAIIIPSDQPNEVIVQGTSAGTITLTCNYSNNLLLSCTGTASLAITLEAPPTITGSRLLCEGESSNYELSTLAAANWRLEGPEGSITYGTFTNFPHSFLLPGTYRLWAEGAFCWPDPIIVVVEPLPSVPDKINGPDRICAGVPFVYTAESSEAESIFEWELVSGTGAFNTSFGSNVSFTGTAPDATTLKWTIRVRRIGKKAPMCAGPWLVKDIFPDFITPAITGNDEPCEYTYQTYNQAFDNGEYYEWTITPSTAGSVVDDIHTSHPKILWNKKGAGAVTLSVKVTKCGVDYVPPTPTGLEFTVNVKTLSDYASTAVVVLDPEYCPMADVYPVAGTNLFGGTITSVIWGDGTTNDIIPHKYKDLVGTSLTPITPIFTISNPGGCIGNVTSSPTFDLRPSPEFTSVIDKDVVCIGEACTLTLTKTFSSTTDNNFGIENPTTFAVIASSTFIPATSWNYSPSTATPGVYYFKPILVDDDAPRCKAENDLIRLTVQDCTGTGGSGGTTCDPRGFSTPATTDVSTTSQLGAAKFDMVSNKFVVDCNGENSFSYSRSANDFPGVKPDVWSYDPGHHLTDYVDDACPTCTTGIFEFHVDPTQVGEHRFSKKTSFYDDPHSPGDPFCIYWEDFDAIVLQHTTFKKNISCTTGGYNLSATKSTESYTGTTLGYLWTVRNLSTSTDIYGPSSPDPTSIFMSPNNNYKITLVVTATHATYGSFECTYEETFSTPALPVANFNVEYTPTCDGTPVKFVSTSTPGTGLTHFWDFNDGSDNYNPERTFTNISGSVIPRDVKLTVTDAYGCADDYTYTSVEVYPRDLTGNISASPTLACPDEVVTLSYSSSTGTPTSYTWIRDLNTRMATTTGASYNMAYPQPGLYFVETRDVNRCISKSSNSVVVNVTGVPDVVISGKHDVCVNEPFVLNAYAGTGIVSYVWERHDGTSWSTVTDGIAPDYDFSESISTSGTYKYRVTIQVLKTGAPTYCYKTSAEFTVEVHDLPATPTIGFNMIACASYQVDLTATSASTGVYNWSNGMSGSPISVNEGGAYRVILTDPFGCTAEAQTDIPKNPKGYLWIFPSGCYQLCPDPDFTLRGPIVPFAAWEWRKNYVVDAGGTGFVAPYTFSTAGTYSLYLDNGLCDATSEEMNFDVQCDNDTCGQNLDLSIIGISYTTGCRATISFSATYWGTGGPVPYSISSSMGGFVTMIGSPSTLSYGVPTTLNAEWTAPSPTGYPSGTLVEFVVTITLPGGATCTKKISVPLNCPYGPVLFRQADSSTVTLGKLASPSKLSVAPNPAQQKTMVTYVFGSDVPISDRSIAVYDMVGRKLIQYPADKAEGQIEIHFGDMASGLYQVVLRSGDKVVQSTALSISR